MYLVLILSGMKLVQPFSFLRHHLCNQHLRCFSCISATSSSSSSSVLSSSQPIKSVGIVGGGFSGLAAAYRLSKHCKDLTIYDLLPPGKASASSAAGGLMHPLSPRGGFVWKGVESYNSSKSLFDEIESISKVAFVSKHLHLYRPIISSKDEITWTKAHQTNSEWIEEDSLKNYPNIYGDGVNPEVERVYRIKNAIIIHAEKYLISLWKSIQLQVPEAKWVIKPIESVQSLSKNHDIIVLAAGAGIPFLWDHKPSDSRRTDQGSYRNPSYKMFAKFAKGINYIVPNHGHSSQQIALSHALLAGEYIVPKTDTSEKDILICGASHDHLDLDSSIYQDVLVSASPPGFEDAKLIERLTTLLPSFPNLLKESDKIRTSSGVRLVTRRTDFGKIPIVGKHPTFPNTWIIAGLGSRGLLYHSLMSEYLTSAILSDESVIPLPLLPSSHRE